MFKKIFASSVVLLLISCGGMGTQFKKMSEPNEGDRARVRVQANMMVQGIPNSDCLNWSKEGAGTIFGGLVGSSGYRGRSLDMPKIGLVDGTSGEFYLRANEPFSFALISTPDSYLQCDVSATFVPEKNADYQINLVTQSAGVTRSICTIQVREITKQGLIPVAIREAKKCR